MDDFDALFAAPHDQGEGPSVALVQALRELELPPVSGSSLAARGDLVRLWRQLSHLEEVVHRRRIEIERSFVIGGAELAADELKTSLGLVRLRLPTADYETQAEPLRRELKALVPAHLTDQELEAACPVTIRYTVNHSKLNALYRHRGEAVAAAIDRFRRKRPPDPLAARPEFPKEDRHGQT